MLEPLLVLIWEQHTLASASTREAVLKLLPMTRVTVSPHRTSLSPRKVNDWLVTPPRTSLLQTLPTLSLMPNVWSVACTTTRPSRVTRNSSHSRLSRKARSPMSMLRSTTENARLSPRKKSPPWSSPKWRRPPRSTWEPPLPMPSSPSQPTSTTPSVRPPR